MKFNEELTYISSYLQFPLLLILIPLMLIIYSRLSHLLVQHVSFVMKLLILQMHARCCNKQNQTHLPNKLLSDFSKINSPDPLELLILINHHLLLYDITHLDPQPVFMPLRPPQEVMYQMWMTLFFLQLLHLMKTVDIFTTTTTWIFSAPIRCYHH